MSESPVDRRAEVLDELVRMIVLNCPKGFAKVAIDGVDAPGQTQLAGEMEPLIEALGRPVVRCSIDGFHHPRADRHRQGRESPRGYYEDSFRPSVYINARCWNRYC